MIEIEKVQVANKQEGLKTLWSFMCPSCSTLIHRPLTDGRKSNSCGSHECKMTIADIKNPRITSKPFYSAIAMQYRYLKTNYELCEEWDTLNKFYKSVYNEYATLRKTSSKIHLTVTGVKATPLTTILKGKEGDYRLQDDGIVGLDCRITHPAGYYDTFQVATFVGTTHANVKRRLRKLQSDSGFTQTTKCTVLSHSGIARKVVAELLTEEQYKELVTSMNATSIKNHPNAIYLIKGAGLTKIGISSNVDSRYRKLVATSPVPLELLFSISTPDSRKVEKELHLRYNSYRAHGEWFKLSPTQIQEITTYLDTKE